MPSANDVYITPASRKIEWYGSSAMKGQIHHDDTNFYVSGTLDLKLQSADDISLMGYSGGSIITFGTDQTERMRLTEAGNLGIGTSAPYQKLDIRGNLAVDNEINFDMDNNATAYGYINWDGYQGGDTQFRSLWIGDGRRSTQSSLPLAFFDGTTRQVGIGTTTPLAAIHINGGAYQQVFTRGSYNHTIVKGNSDDTLTFATGAPGSHTARFKIQPTGIDVVNNAIITGNVGIGTTSPGSKLDIVSTSNDNTGGIRIGDGSTFAAIYHDSSENLIIDPVSDFIVTGSDDVRIQSSDDFELLADDFYFKNDADNSTMMRITSAGNVGIGTTSPSYKLHVSGAATQEVRVQSSDSGAYSRIQLRSATDGYAQLNMGDSGADGAGGLVYTHSTDTLNIRAANSNIANVTATGVGIGTTAPSAPLHVDTTSTSYAAIFQNDSTNGYVMKLVASDSSLLFQTDHIIPTYNMHLGNDNVNFYMRTAGYKFGVGTSSPKTSMSLVGALSIEERADHETTNAGWGQLWVKNDSPNKLYFTDDAGTDHDLTAGGGGTIGGTVSSGFIPVASSADTLADGVLFTSGATESMYIGATPGTLNAANYNTTLGYQAGDDITEGDENTLIGQGAGANLTTGDANTFIGRATGFSGITVTNNTVVGSQAGQNLASSYNTMVGAFAGYNTAALGSYNSFFGFGAGQNIQGAAARNIAIGLYAHFSDTDASASTVNNIAIGTEAMKEISTGYENIGIGKEALLNSKSGYQNTAVGPYAMKDNNTGLLNVAVGAYAATGNTTGQENVAIGHSALQENQEGDHIVAIGRYAAYNTNPSAGTGDTVAVGTTAGFSNTTGVQNTFIGHRAGYSNTTANQQVYVGREAGYSNTTGTTNIFIGARSGYLNTTGANNTVVGHQALYNNVHGDRNTAIGYQALHSSTPSDGGGQNTAVGDRAGYSTTTGHTNVYMGYLAGYSLTDGERNVIIGHEAGRFSSTLDHSVLIGNGAGYNVSGAVESVIMGRNAGYFASGNFNTFIGTQAGRGDTSLTHATVSSVAVGHNAMYYHSTANYSVAVGAAALQGASAGLTGDFNVAVGRQALMDTTSGYGNVAMGYLAGKGVTTGRDNVFIGLQAGQYNAGGLENTIVGYLAGRNNSGNYNTFLGWSAGYDNVGHRNTGLGYGAMYEYKQSGDGYNVAIGMYSMHQVETGSSNVAIGYTALRGATGHDMDYNVAIGAQALYSNTTGDNNVGLGRNTLFSNTTGYNNTALGTQAGENNTTGNGNVFIGNAAGPSSTSTASNELYIHNAASSTPLIKGDFSAPAITVNGTLTVTGSTLAVQREMKNDITTDTTLSDSYSSYQAIADGGSVPTVTLTAPSSPSVGDEYVIVGTCIHFPGPPSTNATVRIVANTGQTINGVNTNIQINTSSSGQTYAIARLICIDTDTWVMEVSSCPVA